MGLFGKGFADRRKELELYERIERLEEKVFKKKKPPTTLGQQILMLHHLGMLDKIYELDISKEKQYELLAKLLNGDASNIKKALISLPKREEIELKIPFNFEALREIFESVDLFGLSQKMTKELAKWEKKEKEDR